MAPDIKELMERLAKLEKFLTDLNSYVTVDDNEIDGLKGPHIIFTGVNVHIRSGAGSTSEGTIAEPSNAPTGLGNLIIGYNEPRRYDMSEEQDLTGRGGSHNLVVGPLHQYSSLGGLVAGCENKTSGPYASVSGGFVNTASGAGSCVSGGESNTASGDKSSVSGGVSNNASGVFSIVSGGESNTASGGASCVSGGNDNTASSGGSSVSGGNNNTANGNGSSVSGGAFLAESDTDGWAAGAYHTP